MSASIKTQEDLLPKLQLNESESKIIYEGVDIPLAPNELIIIKILIGNPGKIITRKELNDSIQAKDNGDMVNVYICRLRDKIRDLTGLNLIRSIRGKGYIFN